jgi:Matrixin
MALASSSSNKDHNNERDISKKGKSYTYVGVAFTILAVLTISYLALILFGILEPYSGMDGITGHLPFYDDVYNEDEFDGYSGRDVILVCCSWGEELADGELTYFINENMIDEGENGMGDKIDSSSIEAVNKAIQEWDSKVEGLSLTEIPDREYVDIEIYFREDRDERAGMTKNYYDFYEFITKSYVMLSSGAFGFGFSDNQIEQISKHEIGHVLGLGHANFDGNLMAAQVNRGSGTVSDCEIDAVYKANEWWFEQSRDGHLQYIRHPTTGYIECL